MPTIKQPLLISSVSHDQSEIILSRVGETNYEHKGDQRKCF